MAHDKELYGLIGYPVKHSFSPLMHQAAFAQYKIPASYELFEVPPEELAGFFKKTIAEKKIRGFNITVPHKENAVGYLTASISSSVRMNAAVNTVRVEADGSLSGFNTDGAGFLKDLKERGVHVKGMRIVLLGSGGGAKAVATSLAASGPKEIAIFDIDTGKSARLAAIIEKFYPSVSVVVSGSLEKLEVGKAGLLINATPIGMKASDPLLISGERLHRETFVYDLIYNPLKTKLLQAAEAAGCPYANGLGMLLYQGCLAFEHWTGKPAPVEAMKQGLEKGVKSLSSKV